MRVALVSQPWAAPLPPSEAVSIFNHEVGRRLALGGEQVAIYAGGDEARQLRTDDGVEYRYVPTAWDWRLARATRPLEAVRRRSLRFYASRLYFMSYFARIAADLRRRGCDVVHLHNFFAALPTLRLALPKATIVLHMHSEWLSLLPTRAVERRARTADVILGASDFVAGGIRAALPELAGRCLTAYNGVDLDDFSPAVTEQQADGGTIVAVGRISPEKGTHVLLNAMERVLARRPQARLVLVGQEALVPPGMLAELSRDPRVRQLRRFYPGPYLAPLLEAAGASVRAAVEVTGHIPHSEVPAHYRRAAVVVNSSLSESFGMSVIEGMASGVPVVGARTGGVTELVEDGRTGVLVEPGEPHPLADALLRVLGDAQLCTRLGRAGRRAAENRFGWDEVTRVVSSAYEAPGAGA